MGRTLGRVCASLALLSASAAGAGEITGSLMVGPVQHQNLSQSDGLDWAVWGYAASGTSTALVPDVRKLGGTAISELINISNGNPLRGLGQFGAFSHSFAWSDGDPVLEEAEALGGLQHDGQAGGQPVAREGFSFTVPAGIQACRLDVYVGTHLGVSVLTASLSDNSAPQWVEEHGDGFTENLPGSFHLTYRAAQPEQTLRVEYVLRSNGSLDNSANAQLFAVALDCVAPIGYCCVGASCTLRTEPDCLDIPGGEYGGDGTDCTGDPCGVVVVPVYESTEPSVAGSVVGNATGSPYRHDPPPEPELYYRLGDGTGFPEIIKLTSSGSTILIYY